MVQLDYQTVQFDMKAGNRMKKKKLLCYTKQFNRRKRPEFNNSNKLHLSAVWI